MMVLVGVLVWTACVVNGVQARQAERKPSAHFERPDAKVIRAEVNKILADPRFAPRKSLMQWLIETLSTWKGPNVELPAGLANVLIWVFTVWALLTLVAILAHLIWTLAVAFGGRAGGRKTSRRRAGATREEGLSYEELCTRMQWLADHNLFRQAISVMMLVLLRGLDRAGTLRFHRSKTNGDYVGEYPAGVPGRDEFRRFSLSFDVLVYGCAPCEQETYQRMRSLFEQVRDDARKEL